VIKRKSWSTGATLSFGMARGWSLVCRIQHNSGQRAFLIPQELEEPALGKRGGLLHKVRSFDPLACSHEFSARSFFKPQYRRNFVTCLDLVMHHRAALGINR
jgi:hypothetical protein